MTGHLCHIILTFGLTCIRICPASERMASQASCVTPDYELWVVPVSADNYSGRRWRKHHDQAPNFFNGCCRNCCGCKIHNFLFPYPCGTETKKKRGSYVVYYIIYVIVVPHGRSCMSKYNNGDLGNDPV